MGRLRPPGMQLALLVLCHIHRRAKKAELLGTQVEELKKTLLLHGGNVSQVVKDVLSDFRKLKGVRAQWPHAGRRWLSCAAVVVCF